MREVSKEDIVTNRCFQPEMEDRVYIQMDKLITLCSIQSLLDSGECLPNPTNRNCFSHIVEEHALELRRLLDSLFKEC